MNEQSILKALIRVGAFLENDHFVYTSWLHGSTYVNKDAVYPHARTTARLCRELAKEYAFPDKGIEVVLGPAMGGIILSQWIAYHLTRFCGREVLGIYAEKEVVPIPDPEEKHRRCYAETGRFSVYRGHAKLIPGKRVLVVEDILNSGGSARKVVELVRTLGGTVTGLAVLCNRGGVESKDVANVPILVSLVNIDLHSWTRTACPLCERKIPINVEVGKGREFLARKNQ